MQGHIKLYYFLLTILVLSLSGCFEVVEEMVVKRDGSGQMTVTLNLSQSKTKVASIMLLDSINGYKVPNKETIQQGLHDAVANLRKTPGISKVSQRLDFDNYIASISFSFSKVADLNVVNKLIYQKLKVKPTGESSYSYQHANHLFVRNYQYSSEAKQAYQKLKSQDKEVFKKATYTSIYRFDSPILFQRNKEAKLSGSKKAVMFRANILDLINGNKNISNQIQLVN
ncbi:hypothetical protein [Olivibacter domesticus]|uniref:Lipoprotein n=1 Tax=Olivibacter domesticus TaxID=407022 RepID=A0A1H7QMM2_OLID1|nr:hypothetical protein [Olivibacter domesticus]SEL49156.1 hypothetical protein SAMN05661044_02653 [Olivibacter domesticus]